MKKIDLLSISVSTGSYGDFVSSLTKSAMQKKSHYTCLANVHMLIEAHKDKNFSNVVKNANVITPDGKPLTWALKLLYSIKQERVPGMDLLPSLLKEAELYKLPVYFYGGTKELLNKTDEYLKKKYPALEVVGYNSPPFRTLTSEENQTALQEINSSKAAFVFVVLGCPKQEKWMSSMLGKVDAVMVGVGGALPVMIGTMRRAPKWMQDAGLEWLFRLIQEPARLFSRYLFTNTVFIFLLMKRYFYLKFRKFDNNDNMLVKRLE